jgi:hypothetical protein
LLAAVAVAQVPEVPVGLLLAAVAAAAVPLALSGLNYRPLLIHTPLVQVVRPVLLAHLVLREA